MQSKTSGLGSGLLGVFIFSGSLPATRVAVADFSPLFLTAARASIAASLAGLLLLLLRQQRPSLRDFRALTIVALGVVLGFPLLTGLALQHMSSAQSVVFIGLLPLATALFAVIRAGERPKPAFWMFSVLGALTVAGFAFSQSGSGSGLGNGLMIAAIIVCGLGYAEGASLSRRLGGWQVISWALLIASPIMLAIAVVNPPAQWGAISLDAWLGLGYVSVFSMLIGFIFWYRGLALGGVASIGQLQLLQPFLGLLLAGLVLHEAVAWPMVAATAIVVACVAGARRFA
ncbi:DMT family transporter [Allorhizobium undicola]|uniref:DMT family transporter n=1 Tax=Allorhizobium undicola TaxID=78527 RepID=UPI00047FA2C3|nr:DMT family transporter [Allorhizobium undicola]